MKRITLALPAPYVGLRPFDEKDALIFFGRDHHVRDLLTKLNSQQRFISVIGASGTGKSSLVGAGLIPALHRGALASVGFQWQIYNFKPGDAPLHNLVHALTEDPRWIDNNTDRTTAEASLCSLLAVSPLALTEQYRQRAERFGNDAHLLVVDQFEEIFRYDQRNSDEAEAFIQLLLRTASEDVPIYVVMTMRSDFLGNCVAFFGLPEAINSGLYLTPRLGPDPLKSIIASPLALVGGDIESVLVTRLINTLGGDDELPILEHALLRMWNHAKGAGRNRIEMQDFEAVCASHHSEQGDNASKVLFSIDNHASSIFVMLTEKQQQLARQMFLALVERRDSRDVRRPQTLKQLTELLGKNTPSDLKIIIDAFRAELVCFLLPSLKEVNEIHEETQIDISHESLFRQWHLFQQWLKDEALDVAELKEWHQRALRQQQGGGWLDENDCIRAWHWCERMNTRADPQSWSMRYGEAGAYEQIISYIENSVQRQNEVKLEHERLQREKQEAVTKQLETEARLQRELAERAEKDRQHAQAFAKASRRRSRIAMFAATIAITFALMSFEFYKHANKEKIRAEKMARDAKAAELIGVAENLAKIAPDQSLLLALTARQISYIPKIEAYLRYAYVTYNYRHVLRGHGDGVHAAQFSPDGKSILTTGGDNTAILWDVFSGKKLHTLTGHTDRVESAQFSPDGKTIITASDDNTIRVWSSTFGELLHVLKGHQDYIESVQFSPTGKTIISTSNDNTVRIWDIINGKQLYVLNANQDYDHDAQFSPDGRTILTSSSDGSVRLWDAGSGKELYILLEKRDINRIYRATFSSDSKKILVGFFDTAYLWDTMTGDLLQTFSGNGEGDYLLALFSPDSATILITTNNTASLMDSSSGKELLVLGGDNKPVVDAQFSYDGKYIVTKGEKGSSTVRSWDVITGEELFVLQGDDKPVIDVQISSNGKWIITTAWDIRQGSTDNAIRLWDAKTGKESHVFIGHEYGANSVDISQDGETLLSTSYSPFVDNRGDRTARLWSIASGNKELQVFGGQSKKIKNAEFFPDGKTILTNGGEGYFFHIWNIATGEELLERGGNDKPITHAKLSADGKYILTESTWDRNGIPVGDNSVRLWNIIGEELQVFYDQGRGQFSPNGEVIATFGNYFGDEYTIRLLDAKSGREMRVFEGHEGAIRGVEFSSDGKFIVSSSQDKTVRLWDIVTGKNTLVISDQELYNPEAYFSPNNKFILINTSNFGESVQLYDAATGKYLLTFGGENDSIGDGRFSPDGKIVLTKNRRMASLWEVSSGKRLHDLHELEGSIWRMGFSPDGSIVITINNALFSRREETVIRLWDTATGKQLQFFYLDKEFSYDVDVNFSPDGRFILITGSHSARLLHCDICDPFEKVETELRRRVGRELTEAERQSFNILDSLSFAN